MTNPKEAAREALPEPMKVVAERIYAAIDDHRNSTYCWQGNIEGAYEQAVAQHGAKGVAKVEAILSAALESERQAHAAEIAGLRADARRLDFLDSLNRALNTQYGTTYQWKLVLSPNVVRLMAGRHDKGYIGDIDLHDSDAHGAASCRAAIDQAIARGKT